MNDGQITIRGYSQAGDDFLALKLRKIFMNLVTPEDVALHNDMLMDIQTMIGEGNADEFRKSVARTLTTMSVRNIENVT